MKVINISDNRKRNTRVGLASRRVRGRQDYVGPNGEHVQSVRMVKGTIDTAVEALTQDISLEELSGRLIEGDPEIDLELMGKQVVETKRIYLDPDNKAAYGVNLRERVMLPDGQMKEEREFAATESNINLERPIKWSGRLLPKAKCIKMFAFVACYQLTHVDGLTYDFLFNMAKELEEKESMLFLAAGDKCNQPLVLTRNSTPYRGFLEGRTSGDRYMLLLHLTNLELKPLPVAEEGEDAS